MVNTDRAYFEEMYGADSDPWGFETRWYEQRKYALTVAALPEARYRSAFEPGCSIGVLTSLLAPRCDRLVATEIIDSALAQARVRLSPFPHVRLERWSIPEQWPTDIFDLIVLSEIAYYFDAATLRCIADRAMSSLSPRGTLVGVHWRGPTDYPLSADDAHEILTSVGGLTSVVHHAESEFVLDVWQKS
jgi:hypothetical protein